MDRPTVSVYDARVTDYETSRPAGRQAEAAAFAATARSGGPVADLGCGPGGYLSALAGAPGGAVGLDASAPMLARAGEVAPGVPLVRADLEALPFRRAALGGAWDRNAYLHVERGRVPAALAQLHAALLPGAPVMLSALTAPPDGVLPEGLGPEGPGPDAVSTDDLPGRRFTLWTPERFAEVVEGGGFAVEEIRPVGDATWIFGHRARTLPDFVGPGMRLLVCGLNPSLVAADAGFGYAGATNRFWTAALDSGLVTVARQPLRALAADGVGMTDMVKRATRRADALTGEEYRAGAERCRRLVEWLRPGLVLMVGLAGWRAAVDRKARPGLQPEPWGGAPVYVMPSTSGLNASATLAGLAEHMRAAVLVAAGPCPAGHPAAWMWGPHPNPAPGAPGQ